MCLLVFFFCKQKTAYEMRISDWSSDVCSSDLLGIGQQALAVEGHLVRRPQEAQLLRLEGRLRHLGQADGLECRRHRWHRPLGTPRISRIAAQQLLAAAPGPLPADPRLVAPDVALRVRLPGLRHPPDLAPPPRPKAPGRR